MKLFNAFPRTKIRVCILATFLFSTMFLSVSYRILDPKAKKPNELLKKIAPQLHKLNIDVVQDWNSKLKADNRYVIVAPLANWPARNNEQFTTGWVKNLNDDLHAGYVKGILKNQRKIERNNEIRRKANRPRRIH